MLKHLEVLSKKAWKYLLEKMELQLNEEKCSLAELKDGFTFLGLNFHNEKISISNHKLKKIQNKIQWILSAKYYDRNAKISKLNESTNSWRYYYHSITEKKQFEEYQQIHINSCNKKSEC